MKINFVTQINTRINIVKAKYFHYDLPEIFLSFLLIKSFFEMNKKCFEYFFLQLKTRIPFFSSFSKDSLQITNVSER